MSERGEIGKRVREARKLSKLRVVDIAEAVEKHSETVYRWETGKIDPPLKDCRVIAALTGVSYAWLVTGEGEPRVAAA